MRHSHTDQRSKRYAARQFVSDYETLEGLPMMQQNGKFERVQGVVKFFSGPRGFGFLTRDDGKPDVFFHIRTLRNSGIQDELREGDRLEFDVVPVDGKGPRADAIKVIST